MTRGRRAGSLLTVVLVAFWASLPTALAAEPAPDLSVSAWSPGLVEGAVGSYTVTITNVGDDTTRGILELTSTKPGFLDFDSFEGEGWTCAQQGQPIRCEHPGPLMPGEWLALTLSVAVLEGAQSQATFALQVVTEGDAAEPNDHFVLHVPIGLAEDQVGDTEDPEGAAGCEGEVSLECPDPGDAAGDVGQEPGDESGEPGQGADPGEEVDAGETPESSQVCEGQDSAECDQPQNDEGAVDVADPEGEGPTEVPTAEGVPTGEGETTEEGAPAEDVGTPETTVDPEDVGIPETPATSEGGSPDGAGELSGSGEPDGAVNPEGSQPPASSGDTPQDEVASAEPSQQAGEAVTDDAATPASEPPRIEEPPSSPPGPAPGGDPQPQIVAAALDDRAVTWEDRAVEIDVLANDTPGLGPVAIAVAPQSGTAVVRPDGTILYTPSPDTHGKDVFVYRASGLTASVSVTVVPVNDPPVAGSGRYQVREGESLVVPLLETVTDPDGDDLAIAWVTQGAHGSVSITGEGYATYRPEVHYSGDDSFSFEACDPEGACDVGTYRIEVVAVNDLILAAGVAAGLPALEVGAAAPASLLALAASSAGQTAHDLAIPLAVLSALTAGALLAGPRPIPGPWRVVRHLVQRATRRRPQHRRIRGLGDS